MGWQSIAFTDGSMINGISAWAAVFADDWFWNNYEGLPNEQSIRYNHIQEVAHVSGTNDTDYSTGIYDAELQAILRALIAVPVSCPITIYADNQAAKYAIASPPTTARALYRRSGRTWLNII